jgi:hypothetical protein
MRAVVVELRRTLPGPRNVVWRLITDWERQGEWMLEASDFVVTTRHREGIGVECEATIRVAGIKTRDRVRIVTWEPQRHVAIEHLGWVKGRGDIWLEDGESGTALRWREELCPPMGLLGAIGLRAYRPVLERTFRRDLGLLARLAADANAT